jgi:hypothetical protein
MKVFGGSLGSLGSLVTLTLLLLGGADGGYLTQREKNKKKAGYNETSALDWIIRECTPVPVRNRGVGQCLTWSTGMEHETLVVHGREDQVDEYVVNVGAVALQMSRYGRAFGLDREAHSVAIYLQNTGVEFSGRECAGLNELNFRAMAESVSLSPERLSLDSAFCQISRLDSEILGVLGESPVEAAISKRYGDIRRPRSGMSAHLGLYTRTGGKTHVCSSCQGCDLKDYTGSYHISISLPRDADGWVAYDEDILEQSGECSRTYFGPGPPDSGVTAARDSWVEAHANLANMIQWVEPLIMAVFGASDSEAVCDNGRFVEGSYRTMNSGWGVPGTTDVRTFNDTATGRYSDRGFDWMLEVAPSSCRKVLGCAEEGMGTDIRTLAAVATEDAPDTPPMEVGHGIELRFLDNFPIENLKTVYRFVALIAEASRVHLAESYVYDDPGWVRSAQRSILEGWNAILPPSYVSSLESSLDIDLSGLNGRTRAFDVLNDLYARLWAKHGDGFWTGLLLDDVAPDGGGSVNVNVDVNPNRESWETGALLAGITPDTLRDMFGSGGVPVEISDLHLSGSGVDCLDDVEDMVYLAESLGMVDAIETNPDGSVKSVTLLPEGGGDRYTSHPRC